jgi:hypothetical protein
MSVIEPPLVDRSPFSPADDELDGLLRSFFRAEAPNPWPALQPPAAALPIARAVPRRPLPLSRSRVALAASVALLFGGQAWLYHSHQAEETSSAGSSSPGDLTAMPDRHGTKPKSPGVPVPAKENGPRSLPVKPMR